MPSVPGFGVPGWLRLSIAGAATLMVGMGLGRFSFTPMIPALVGAGALSAAEAGSVGAGNLFGYLVGAVAAPHLRRRWGEARTLRICLGVALVCLVASIPPWGFLWLAFWRFLIGAAVAVMMIYGLAIVTRHAPPSRLGAATGIVFTGVGVGILLAGALVPALLAFGLEAAWAGLAALGAAGVGLALWGWGAAGPDPAERGPGEPASRPGGLGPPRVVAALVAARTLFSLGLIPHSIFWVDYLVRGLGHEIALGGLQWALFGLGALSGTYLWGRLADRIGFRAGLAAAFAALAAGVALPVLHPAGWALVASSLVVGAQPGLTAILAGRTHQLVGARRMAPVSRQMALVSGVAQAGGGYTYVALFEVSGSYVPLFLAGGAAMAAGAVIAALLKAPTAEARTG